MRIKIAQECGQRWYRKSSWYGVRHWPKKKRYYPTFRRLPSGFAFGPIMMFVKKG